MHTAKNSSRPVGKPRPNGAERSAIARVGHGIFSVRKSILDGDMRVCRFEAEGTPAKELSPRCS